MNKSLLNKVKEKAKETPGAKIVDLGACVLHANHNAFSKGLKIGSEFVDTAELAKTVNGFFKYSVIRREDFAAELVDLEKEEKNFIRHVDTRWLTLKPALERLDEQYEAVDQYFIHTVPEKAKDGDQNYREALKRVCTRE